MILRVSFALVFALAPFWGFSQWYFGADIAPLRTQDVRYQIPGIWESNRISVTWPTATFTIAVGRFVSTRVACELSISGVILNLPLFNNERLPIHDYTKNPSAFISSRVRTILFKGKIAQRPINWILRTGLSVTTMRLQRRDQFPNESFLPPLSSVEVTGNARDSTIYNKSTSQFRAQIEIGTEAEMTLTRRLSVYAGLSFIYGLSEVNKFYGEYYGLSRPSFNTLSVTSNGTGLLGFVGMRFYLPKKDKGGKKSGGTRPVKL
jgi:hypothetical protein